MSKKLIPLLILLLILGLAVALKVKSTRPSYDMAEEMAVESLVPSDFLVSQVHKMEIYAGSQPDSKVMLVKKPTGWVIETAFDAPGKARTIEEFLETVKKLAGEVRPSTPEVLSDFGLDEKQALHVKIYRTIDEKEKKETTDHLLIGKTEEENASFVRKAASDTVYRVGKSLRSALGQWGEDTVKGPDYTPWLDKTILSLNKDEITGISLQYPDKSLVFTRVVEEEKVIEEPKSFTDTDKKDEKNEKVPPTKDAKKFIWQLTSGGPEKKFTESELTNLLATLAQLEGADVVDPSKKEEWGMNEPGYRLEITLADGKKKVLLAAHKDVEKEAYCSLAETPNLIYKLENWNFTSRLFKKGGKFFSLPSWKIEPPQIQEIQMDTPEGKITLSRLALGDKKDERVSWKTILPREGMLLQGEACNEIARKLTSLKLDDYTDETNLEKLELSKPTYQLTVVMKDESRHTLKVGKASVVTNGYYVTLDDQKIVGVLEKADFASLFPSVDKLFALEPLSLKIDSFTLTSAEKSFQLKQENGVWYLFQENNKAETDPKKVEDLVKNFAPLKASKMSLQQSLRDKKSEATLLLEEGESKHTVSIYPKEETLYPILISGQGETYWLEAPLVENILKEAKHYELEKKEPPTEKK